MKVMLDEKAFVPTRAHEADAGLDILTPIPFLIQSGQSIVIDTGVHIELPKDTVGFLKSKSGLCMNRNIVTEGGVIDEGYTGSIKVKLYNNGEDIQFFKAGEKITQLVILPVVKPSLEIVSVLDKTERGNNGFGSSGR